MAHQKRNMWIAVKDGIRKSFSSEKEALAFEGQKQATFIVEEPINEKETHIEEETSTNEQETVFESEGGSEEEIQGVSLSVRKWMASKDV